mmetsp:Transcript_34062/g.38698  ORF Transcript_34062/g.38698 Transcript_34062/m.38698 type:complete len:166 (+) Transcript_34062:48-545(+)
MDTVKSFAHNKSLNTMYSRFGGDSREKFRGPYKRNGTYYGALNGHQDPNPSINAKSVYYKSDGRGRDSYVGFSDGGFHKSYVPGEMGRRFENSLRGYSPLPNARDRRDVLANSQYHIPDRHVSTLKRVASNQRQLDSRLAEPKRNAKVRSSSVNRDFLRKSYTYF